MDVLELQTFECVARHGAMVRAAAELGTVQSNVTARIQSLEKAVGAALLHRAQKGVQLTDAGERLLPFARRAASLLQDAKRAIANDCDHAGELKIGCTETLAATKLGPCLPEFIRRYPDARPSLTTAVASVLISKVADGHLDGALVPGFTHHPELCVKAVAHERLCLVTSSRYTALEECLVAKVLRLFVTSSDCPYNAAFQSCRSPADEGTICSVEIENFAAILNCVQDDLGVVLMPSTASDAIRAKYDVNTFQLPRTVSVTTNLVHRKASRHSPLLSRMVDCLTSAGVA